MENLTKKILGEITYEVVGAAIEVHKTMGSGLLESVYHQCMRAELEERNVNFSTELKIPMYYKTKPLDLDFRCDFFIENCLLLELKAVNEMHSIFDAQLLTYMKLLKAPKVILINFNCANIFKEGQKTLVNEYFKLLK